MNFQETGLSKERWELLKFVILDYIDIRENEAENLNRKSDQKFTSITNDIKCMLSDMVDWKEDFSHENGNYFNTCCSCGMSFKGHKRRVLCKVCG